MDPVRLDALLGKTLGRIALTSGSAASLQPIWQQVVGDLVASHARCQSLENGCLIISCDARQWRDELHARRSELLMRFTAALGGTTLRGLTFITESR